MTPTNYQATPDDEGKPVVYGGDAIGRVVDVTDGTAYVDPEPDLTDVVTAKLGWATAGDDTFPLRPELVRERTDDAIYLGTDR